MSPWRFSASQTTYTKPIITASHAEEDRHERQPNDANGVHGKSDVFSFVEILGNPSCFNGVQSTVDDQDHVVHQ